MLVEKIEDLDAELAVHLLRDRRMLEDGKIVISKLRPVTTAVALFVPIRAIGRRA